MPGIESLMASANPYLAAGQAALGVAGGVMQLVQAGKETKEAKQLQKGLVTPYYNIQKPILDNQALSESLAGQGLSDQALETYRSSVDRSLNNSVNAILMGGGSVNNISDLFDTAQNNDQHIALLDEEVRQKNLQNLMKQNETLAGEQEKAWMINQYAPYQDTKQLISQLKTQANQNKWAGINSITGAVGNAAIGGLMSDPGAAGGNGSVRSRTTSVSNPNATTVPTNVSTGISTTIDTSKINPVLSNYYLDMLQRRSFAQ